jgi:FAD/FMN-containing dehydrogenase
MTCTFSADLTLDEASEQLRQRRQWLPVDGRGHETLGALVERNSTGPLRLGYGAWRDLLLGVQFLNGESELISTGGRVLKNVAGYDLTKFMIGQGGVFGRIVTLTTRTYRLPGGAMIAKFPPEISLLHPMLASRAKPHWAVLTTDALLCGYLGDEQSMRFFRLELELRRPLELRELSVEQEIGVRRELWQASTRPRPAGWCEIRVSVPPSRVHDFCRIGKLEDWVADAAFGVVLAEISRDRLEAVRHAAAAVGGRLVAIDQRPAPISDLPEGERLVLEHLKRAFDPSKTLASLP